jgi:hypothetical protein
MLNKNRNVVFFSQQQTLAVIGYQIGVTETAIPITKWVLYIKNCVFEDVGIFHSISLYTTFVNTPALQLKNSLRLLMRAAILTKV